jgi:hypothetical protein
MELGAFRAVSVNLYLRDTHILGARGAVMVHIVHGASITINCYAGDRMRRYDGRKSDYDQMIEGRTGGAADAPAECLHGVPGGCHLRSQDNGGAA